MDETVRVSSDSDELDNGSISEIDGEERHKLLRISTYWFVRTLEKSSFAYGKTDNTDILLNDYAAVRLNCVAQFLSEEE